MIAIVLVAALRVAFVGDSITASHYPEIAAKMLGTKLYRYAEKSADAKRIDKLLTRALKIRPTHVVLYAGINDCMKFTDPATNAYLVHGRIMWLVRRILDAKAIPIVVAPHGTWKFSVALGLCMESVEFQLEDTATVNMRLVETRMFLSDQEGDLEPEYDAGDGLHLSYAGQRKLAVLVVAEILNKTFNEAWHMFAEEKN